MTQRREEIEREDLLATALSEMPDAYIDCRDISHPWQVTRNYHIVDASRDMGVSYRKGHAIYVRRLLVCPRCGKKRSDAYVISGSSRWQGLERLNTTYSDPPGYSVKGIGRLSGVGELVRGEAFNRVMSQMQQVS